MSNLLQVIKTAAVDAVNASNPVSVLVGNVIEVSPLKINLNQKLTLEDIFLIVPEHLTDHEQKMIIADKVKNPNGEIEIITEEKTVTVKNALKKGDKVILLRMQGGQKYYVLDRVVIKNAT